MLLLTINPDKVRQAMNSGGGFMVMAEHLEPKPPGPESAQVHGTITAMPASLERARERLLALRQNLIASGVRPLSADELEREIDETRGRS
jgi:hypothetical protein